MGGVSRRAGASGYWRVQGIESRVRTLDAQPRPRAGSTPAPEGAMSHRFVPILTRRPRSVALVVPLLALAVLGAAASCDDSVAPEEAERAEAARITGVPTSDRALLDQLVELRRVTAPHKSFSAAQAAGYNAQLTECMTNGAQGGQGFHYGKQSIIDASVDPLQPELLMYEPGPNGQMELVGVEYIVPFTVWTASAPPSLFGRSFHRNETFGLWVLHAWVWRQNPSGVWADWNPTVRCG